MFRIRFAVNKRPFLLRLPMFEIVSNVSGRRRSASIVLLAKYLIDKYMAFVGKGAFYLYFTMVLSGSPVR